MIAAPIATAFAVGLIHFYTKVAKMDGKLDALTARVDLIMEYFHLEPKDNDSATKTD